MLEDRARKVLLAVIQSYIENPEPVGSRFVTRRFDFGVSPATIRNIMADLEEMGYLMQPHTSSGRVPTDTGYRYYVGSLIHDMDTERLEFSDQIIDKLEKNRSNVDGLLRETTKIMSDFSHYLAIASPPRAGKTTFHKIDFILYKEHQIAIVLLTDEGLIKHRMIRNDLRLKQADLNRFAEYINSRHSGSSIDDIRARLIEEMKKDKDVFDALMKKMVPLFEDSLDENEEVFISGLNQVVNLPDFASIDRIKALSDTIEEKHKIVKLLDGFLREDGVNVMIGEENPYENMKHLSLVTSTYRDGERSLGVVGVIGPRRMNYQAAIAIVDTAARFISKVLVGE